MAKGNMLLGYARGQVGDVVFKRVDGQQVAVPRNRTPRNPRTDAQMLQRAISATIMQAYSAGKAIFDHSFEGKQVPFGNMRAFLSENMRQLRSDYANDLAYARTDENGISCFVTPKSNRPVPYTFTVSKGSLEMKLFNVVAGTSANKVAVQLVQDASGTIGDWAQANNVVPGDIYTIVGFGAYEGVGAYDKAPETRFGFIRLIVKANVLTSSTSWATATLADIFDIDENGSATPIPGSTLASAAIDIDQVVSSCLTGAIGVIRSRDNSGLRSNCRLMTKAATADNNRAPMVGLKSDYVLDDWTNMTEEVTQSSRILEGGNF